MGAAPSLEDTNERRPKKCPMKKPLKRPSSPPPFPPKDPELINYCSLHVLTYVPSRPRVLPLHAHVKGVLPFFPCSISYFIVFCCMWRSTATVRELRNKFSNENTALACVDAMVSLDFDRLEWLHSLSTQA